MDAWLTAIIGLTQLILGGLGVYVSLKPPRQDRHRSWMGAFIGVGLLGVGLTGWLAQRASESQEYSTRKITEAVSAATNANTAATNANNSALDAQKEVKNARDEARIAKDDVVLPSKTGHLI